MPNKITYTITTSDGKSHQVSEENINKYGMQSYADAYKGATIRMRDKDGADYDIPLGNYDDAQRQGLHPFRFNHTPDNTDIRQEREPQETQNTQTQKPWKPTAQQRAVMTANLEGISRSAQRTMEDFNERMDNLQEYGKRFGGGQTVSGGLRFNPGTKKMERTYLTPTGERTFNKTAADAVSREYRQEIAREEENRRRRREEEAKMQHDPTMWETVKKSLGAGFLRVGAGLIDTMQSLTSNIYVENPSSPTGYTRTRSYEERLADKNDPLTIATSRLHDTADRMSEESQPHSGRKGFLDMLWDGEIGGFLQKGIATAGESLPMTLSAFNPYTMVLNAISMAGGNYRENTLENPDIPAWKRASQAIGSAAIEQAVEKYADPIFKYVGGGKLLKGASKDASDRIANEITRDATETLAKRIYGRLKGLGKDALGEGTEEVITNIGNDVLGETLDLVDGNEDYGLRAQWENLKKEHPDANLWDFAKAKAKENVESFIGGAMAGAYTSGTAQLTTKALQYSFDRLGNGSVEENEGKPLNPLNVDLAQSYDDGYSEEETTGLQDTKNLYELRQGRMAEMLGVDIGQVDEAIGDPINFIGELQQLGRDDEIQPVLDYVNSKAKYDGMIQRVRDDIDGRIEQSNRIADERTNHDTGMIQGVTMKMQDENQNDRRAYVLSGNLVMLPDGTGIDRDNSDGSIIIRDADTGAIEMVSPDAIFSVEQPIDPETEKMTAAEAIRQQFAAEAAGRIDGVVALNPGDTYTLTDENGQAVQIQIVANQDGLVDNGDGTVNVSSDGGQTIVPMSKEDIQAMVDATNRARVARLEEERGTIRTQQPTYNLNEEITLTDENGNAVRGSITADANEDGQYEVYTEAPINGRKVNLFTAEELDRLRAVSDENIQQNGEEYTGNGNNGAENIPQNGNIEPQNIPASTETLQADGETLQENLQAGTGGASALERIPKDEQGQPLYEQADPEIAWDAIVEQTEGDEAMAQSVADSMVADKEAELKKIEKVKPKTGTTIAEKIAAERERKNAVEQAKANLALWQKIAQTSQRRKQAALAEQSKAAEEAARLRRAEEEKLRAEREEAERIRREALNGVPDFVEDTPQDARARGFRRVNGNKVDRQQAIPTRQGNEVQVKFDDNNIPTGHVSLIDASQLQPSHINGQRNPLHFIDEAQPKERNDEASVMSARKIAANIRPEEITSSVTAYTGAPTVNSRGEVIQGNNRSAALREMWAEHPGQATKYKQYLTEHAADFGLAHEDVEAMQQPVLVNMLDVTDDDAIALGQFVAQDTESGGTERIKPKNIVQKMGGDMRSFAGRLLASPDEEMSFAELIDRNGLGVLKWMQQKGYITPTQYKSAFDSKDNLTAEAKNDLKGVMYQSIFQNGNTHLEEMFNALPSKAQKAILATAYRDYDSPNAERMNAEIQNSISAYYALSQDPAFANAKNYKEARIAAESWKRQLAFDDVTGESYLPSEKYSNFALLLATMYKGQTQTFIQNTFTHIFDLVQGTQETTLFNEPDNTPRTLAEAINEAISNVRTELLINNQFNYNGQQRSNVLAGDSATGQQGRQGSDGGTPSGERVEGGDGTADRSRGTGSGSTEEEIERREAELASRVEVSDDDWQEGDNEKPTYKRNILIDGKHTATQVDQPDKDGHYTGSYFEFDNKRFGDIAEVVDYIDNGNTLASKIAQAEAETDTEPTEAQKEAGNYKKGHVRIGQFDITVENPKGSVRRGTDASGKEWEQTMQNTYGYIRGTEGVDGDHIDVFLTNDIDGWSGRRVYVVDQYNEDGTFDEHKVMLGFNDEAEAQDAYLSNYEKGWSFKHKLVLSSVNLPDFEKWINSSHRKTKPFAEYKSVNKANENRSKTDADQKRQLSDFNVGDVVRDYYNKKLYRIKKHSANGVSTIAELDDNGNEISTTTINAHNNPRYSLAKSPTKQEASTPTNVSYSIEPAQYTTKRGKVLDMFLVTFAEPLSKEQQRAARELAKAEKGWYDRDKGGFMMRSEESARKLADTITGNEEAVSDAQPLSLADTRKLEEPVMRQVDVDGLMQEIRERGEAKLSDHFVDEQTGEKKPKNSGQFGLVSDERMEELKKLLRQKIHGQMNAGIPPEVLAWGMELTAGYIDRGIKKFTDYAKVMIDDMGDVIRPYLKAFYNGTRDLPEVQGTGLANEMTPYEEVRTFDVANFDKGHSDALATAEMVVQEQEADKQADEAKEKLINQRNEQRRKEDEQTTADTTAIASKAEAVASKAESDIEAATTGQQVNNAVESIDKQLEEVNKQLALLGYYEAEPVESDFNEAYGYMRNAEKKAVKDANNLAKRLVNDLGIDPDKIVDKKGKKRRSIATANIAPAGGDISIYLPLSSEANLYLSIGLAPTYERKASTPLINRGKGGRWEGDNLEVEHIMYRIEQPNANGSERYGNNNFADTDVTYSDLLKDIRRISKKYLPIKEEAKEESGEKNKPKDAKNKKKTVSSQTQVADLFGGLFEENASTETAASQGNELNRKFAMTVKDDMLAALDNGTKPYRSILDLRKRARGLGMEVDNDGRTDILLQELVEDGLVRAAREVAERHGSDSKETYDLICKLYEMQPTIAARSSNRIKMQQYSTPLPMAWNAARFVMTGKKDGKVLEPTAGNGMLVFAIPAGQVHANELDGTRLANLREQGFAQVTQQDAVEPFEGGKQYDVVIANPPFGKREAVDYDGKLISGLDPQITLNALASMKDDGKAVIIIGGNMEYAKNGAINNMKPFFTYLYDHYNVKGVVDMDGSLYAKQGTTYPTRMILIDGRRSDEERAQSAVYPPVQSKAIRKADSFETLYDIIDEVINSKEKTNGTEILRSQQGQLVPVTDKPSRNTDGERHTEQPRTDDTGRSGGRTSVEGTQEPGEVVLRREHRTDTGNGETRRGTGGNTGRGSRGVSEPDVQRVERVGVSTERVGLEPQRTSEQPKKRGLSEEKLPYRPHNSAFSLESVAPAAMVEAMDRTLSQIEKKHGHIDEFVRKELGYGTTDELHQALAAEQVDSVAMAIYQMKQGQALIIGDQTGVGKGRQMAALIRWAVRQGEKPIFITQKADLFSDIYRDLVDIGSGDLVPFIFNSPSAKENKGEMVDANGKVVYKGLSDAKMKKVLATGKLSDEYDYAVLTYSQVNTGDEVSQKEMEEAAKKNGARSKKSKNVKSGKATPKATFLRAIAEDNYLFLDESHTAAGSSNTGAYLQSILRSAKAATFASATFAKRPDTMPLYAIRTAMSQAKVEPDKLISIIEKGGVTLQEIMSRELTNAGQMVRRERDMSDVVTDWKTINDPETVRRARENYDRTIAAFNAIIKFQEDYVKPMVDAMDKELAVMAESAGIKRGTDKMGVENVPFASKTYNYTKQLMLALKVDAIANEVDAEIKAGRHPVIALESTMESSIKDYSAGEVIAEPTFSASLLRGLDTVMQYTIKDENGKEQHARYSPKQLGEAGEKAYYELQDFIRESTSDIFISPLDAIIERLHDMGYKVGELTGRNMYVERDNEGRVIVKRRTDKDKKRMQREFNNGELDVLILNKSASTGISLHASEKFSDQRQRTMIIAQPLSDINDYMQMIGRIDRTGQVHRGYYINLGLPVPAENRFLMMLSTKLKSLNANTTTSQDSESNEVEAPDLLNKYGSQVVVEYLRDNPDIYDKMGRPLKKNGENGGTVSIAELDEYKPQEDDARKITGYVALLTTKEQEEFYDDVVRRYNELIKYLNDTGNNDLKITVMPLRAKTLTKRVSSEGIDPTGANPFAQNSYVEQVEMDVLRKPMKAAEIRKTIEQVNKGKRPEDYIRQVISTIEKEDEARIAAEEARYERSKVRAQEDIAKQTEKINRQQKRSAEEKQAAIADYVKETNENVETKHSDNLMRLNTNSDMLKQRLHMFDVGMSYLMPDNLESMVFDFSTPAIFCGYKAKDSKITASTTLAVFATLDGRRRVEVKLSDIAALRSIYKTTNDNWDAARSTTLENWDSQIPTGTRKTGYIMTGNILQAIADTQDERGGFPGQLISYTDIDGNVHDGILMPDKWNRSMLKTSGAPIISRIKQIKDYMPVTSHDGKVEITGSSWAKMYYLTVPKTKKDGAVYYENKTLLRAVNGGNFYPYRGKLRADIPAEHIESVVKELSKLGVKVQEEAKEDDVMLRNGNGALTDDDLSMANAPVSKLLGKSTRTARQRKAFAERERGRMVERVRELAETLHLDNVDIVTDASTLQGNRAKAKGFYSRSTGRITIVIPNQTSVFDAEQTLLHEAVAHYGLRELFGEHFDTFLDNVFQNAEEGIRKRINQIEERLYQRDIEERTKQKGGGVFARAEAVNEANDKRRKGDYRKTATEEYLASLAENTNFENVNASWWSKIKELFLRMLHKIGFENFSGVTLSDNELRYILWRSYENLAEPGRYRSILGEAEDVAKQNELKVGNYAVVNSEGRNVADNDLYRDSDTGTLRQRYDRAVRTPNKSRSVKWYESIPARLKESYVDSMRALHVLMKLISEETGNEIKGFEDAYKAENRMSSENKGQKEVYNRDFYKPLIEAVMNLIRNGATYEEVKRYAIAKHGLERNQDMAERDAEKDYEITQKVHPHSKKTLQDFIDEYRKKDYSGLTALTETDNVADAEAAARQIVSDFEGRHDTTVLWDRINAATKETLRKSYDSGLMDKATYDKVRDMYQYYIPLRGWDCEVASNEYEYLMSGNHLMLSPVLQTAKGRTSLADDPFAVIGFMAENSIIQGNRNRMKQKFLNFVLNNPTDLVTVSEQWYVLDNATGKWEPRNPIIPEDATGDEVDAILEQHEQDMKALGDKATKKRSGLQLDMHITKREGQEHVVKVKRGGKEYCLYINGNPRAAQALNGITNPDVSDSKMRKAAQWLKNFMAQMFTSKNPTFIFRNMTMDAMWAGTAVAIKENKDYVKKYTGNITRAMLKAQLPRLLAKFQNGKLDKNVEIELYFDEFIRNGGETGFTQLNTVENYKRDIKRFVKEAQGRRNIPKKAWDGLWDGIEFMNRSAEDTTRFMVYMTSRQMGRNVARSVWDAKEITVNFNKKGSGGLGADFMNFCYIFFNAAIQSMANFGRLMYHHPAKTMAALTLFSSAGFIVPMLNLALIAASGGDDDDDDNTYWDLPEWVRRSNIVLYIPFTEKGFITIPLSHELRPFYGMGEIAFSCLMRKESPEEALKKAAAGFSGMSPVDLTGNGGNIAVNMTPTIGQPFAQIIANTDYFGKPIYRRYDWNELDPEWTKAYKGTSSWLVDGTRWLNEFTGGDNVESGTIDWNPAIIEHLFEGYFGGMGKTLNKAQKTLEMMWNEDMREWRNVPVMSSFYQDGDVRTAGSQLNREYYEAVEEMKETEHLFSGYKKQLRMGAAEYGEKLDELVHSEVFKRYRLVKGYNNAIRKLTDAMERVDPTKRKDVETAILNLKVEMFEKLQKQNMIKDMNDTRK